MLIEKNKSLKELNTFHIDATAALYIETDSIQKN